MVPTSNIFKEYMHQGKEWRTGGMKLWNIYIFRYDFWWNDMTPMILPFKFEPQFNTVMGLNLHYLHPEVRIAVLETIDYMKLINPDTKEILIDYSLLQRLFKDTSIALRRYKQNGVSFLRHVPLDDFIDRHWQSPGAMDASWRMRMHQRSLMSLQGKLHDRKRGVL